MAELSTKPKIMDRLSLRDFLKSREVFTREEAEAEGFTIQDILWMMDMGYVIREFDENRQVKVWVRTVNGRVWTFLGPKPE